MREQLASVPRESHSEFYDQLGRYRQHRALELYNSRDVPESSVRQSMDQFAASVAAAWSREDNTFKRSDNSKIRRGCDNIALPWPLRCRR